MTTANYPLTIFLKIILLCSFATSGLAQPFAIEGKVGAFIPSSNKIRHIFHDALPFVEVEGNYQFYSNWKASVGVGYIFAKGKSGGCHSSTTINVIPFTVGIKHFFSLTNDIDAFLGAGGLWTLYKNRDRSPSVHQHISKNAFGAIVSSGLHYRLNDRVSLALFGEYMYQHFNFTKVYKDHFTYRHDVDMSGTKIGFSFGYTF